MDHLDGVLLVPPDRSQILGRPSWKPRYVVVGRRSAANTRVRQASLTVGRSDCALSKALAITPSADDYCISVYKSKDDLDPIKQWSANSVADCQVQLVTNRKQSPVLPTLVITIADKERRRRSSRATGFMYPNKESATTTLWFRTPPDHHHPSLHDWARFILSKKGATPSSESPVSPIFTSPFATRSHESSDHMQRPGSGSRALKHQSSTATYSTGPRDHIAAFGSESPSLRSKRSDISSPSSTYAPQKLPYAIPEQHYTTVLPSDLGSSTTLGDYRGEFIEGWTSAQGRSSTMSSPTQGRDSISSQALRPSIYDAASPPAPGETILDRAFQLGQIPGAESYVPGQENLSSIARFDALMREAEERRKQNEADTKAERVAMRSTFEDDDSSDEAELDESDVADSDSVAHSEERDGHGEALLMSPGAQRALAYIAGGRRENGRSSASRRPGMSRANLSFHAGAEPASSSPAPVLRPHTAHAKSRHNGGQSTPRVTPAAAAAPDPPSSTAGSSNRSVQVPNAHAGQASGADNKRNSSSSTKRLSFTEFTKRLSSTSSLLLVQTNASAGSSRGSSSEVDVRPSSAARTNLTLRGASGARHPPQLPSARSDQPDRRCGWRGSIVGAESFL
ncbi:Uncharacterized protein TCAP_04401 [Tolypocladium capitatum]|uniref:PH domain-containing protein n=1 Tax=Tolypocladium capitatum TaxID=45235 RepID=A0A2K3QDP3_9HYPO|nr:Uncharacterized protein TCAP_04401 [Tolypocladium capitatum]